MHVMMLSHADLAWLSLHILCDKVSSGVAKDHLITAALINASAVMKAPLLFTDASYLILFLH